MAIAGLFASHNGIAGEAAQSFSGAVLKYGYASDAPMTALRSGVPNTRGTSKIVNWFEEPAQTSRTTSSTNLTDSGTSIVVADASFILPKSVLLIESTGEHVYVSAVSGTTLTVQRGMCGTTAQAVNGSSTPFGIQFIASVHEELSSAPAALIRSGYMQSNYMEIFRNSFGLSRSASLVQWNTDGNKEQECRNSAITNHASSIERASLFGRKAMQVINSKPAFTMQGLIPSISTNVKSIGGGGLTYDDLVSFINSCFTKNISGKPNERLAYVGNTALTVIQKILRTETSTQIILSDTTEKYGLNIRTLVTALGSIKLLTHPVFNESPVYTKALLVFHPGALSYEYLTDAQVTPHANDGTDGMSANVTSELSLKYTCECTAGIMTGIATAAS